jgi:hypothetical protein
MPEHFVTTYSSSRTFEEKNEKNRAIMEAELVPALNALDLKVVLASADKEAVSVPAAIADEWLDFRGPNPYRPPDLLCHNPWGTSCKYIWVEFKDFPMMQKYPCTGFQLKHLRTYLSVQHHFETPVLVLFRDSADREVDNKLGEGYRSAFIRGGKEHFYGGLLADLKPNFSISLTSDSQVRWYSQESLQERDTPVMRTLEEIASDLRAGKVLRKEVPPEDLEYWGIMQHKCGQHGFSPMREPKKLVVFRTDKRR